ncbi:unnamed protein product [Brugia pahangi]|uniref:Clathrin_bdg domain-containing protein n=1 Tax=Brugia pahangi TaxID=6280 RepID=A0A0N4TSN6_BRUPA|nr:unnamed protein product [Brugia pahangi]
MIWKQDHHHLPVAGQHQNLLLTMSDSANLYDEYDEAMRTSILDFNTGPTGVNNNLTHLNLPLNTMVTCPRVISENDSLCMYDASPSPPHQEEEINFVDELTEMNETVNKWTPEALLNFAKETFGENSETERQLNEKYNITSTITKISKSLGNLHLWETEMGWITRKPSVMDHSGIVMRQSISCHDQMITSYVDCVIQNHYNRCSSPDCRKYASKPDTLKKQMMTMNSESDTSDDEWIRCVDDVPLDETRSTDNHSRNEIYAQVTKLTANEEMIKVTNQMDYLNDDESLSYQSKYQHTTLNDPMQRRSYSLNILDQLPETLIDLEKERYLFITKMITTTDKEHYYADIRDLSDFNQHAIYYTNMSDKHDLEYESDESIKSDSDNNDNEIDVIDDFNDDNDNDHDNLDNDDDDTFTDQILPVQRSKLPNFYEFTFDIKKTIHNDSTKLLSNIDKNVYPVIETYKPEIDEQIMNSTVTLWDNSCEYAQQINEIARVWIQKTSETSNISEIINTQQTSTTIYPKSDNLTNSTMEAIALNNQCLPASLPVDGMLT